MNDSLPAKASTFVSVSGLRLRLLDAEDCILADVHFTHEAWGKACMAGSTPVMVDLHAPVLEKHLVRLVPAKAEVLNGFREAAPSGCAPAVVSVDGMHPHRLFDRDNGNALTEEGRFAAAWMRMNQASRTNLAYLLTPSPMDQRYPITPSDRDCEVAATVIQWLGSPVGQGFLRDLGYTKGK